MGRRKIAMLTITLLCGLLLAGGMVWAMSLAGYAIKWDIIGGGGGPISSASYTVDSTVGQAAIGPSGSASYRLGAGYWYMLAVPVPPPVYWIHLPLVVRNYR